MVDDQTQVSSQDIERLEACLGRTVLDYVFAGAAWGIESAVRPGVSKARAFLVGLQAKIRAEERGRDEDTRRRVAITLTKAVDGLPCILRLREQCGGSSMLTPGVDPVVNALLLDTEMAYVLSHIPMSRLPHDQNGDVRGLFYEAELQVRLAEAALAMAQDQRLQTAFGPGSSEASPDAVREDGVVAAWNIGEGGTHRLSSFPWGVVKHAVFLQFLSGIASIEGLDIRLAEAFERCAGVFDKRHSEGAVVVALENMRVPAGFFLELGDAHLVSPLGLQRLVPWVTEDTTCVLVFRSEVRLEVCKRWKVGEDPGDDISDILNDRRDVSDRLRRSVTDRTDSLRLALLLASDRLPFLAPAPIALGWMHPAFGGGGSWSTNPRLYPATVRSDLDLDAVARVEAAVRLVGNLPGDLRMAARRLVASASERIDYLDSMVDAVICWEALMGPRGAITFRLCASIAWLLEPTDREKRLRLFDELDDLYDVRSRALHGDSQRSERGLAGDRNRAVHLAVAAFRAVLEDQNLRDTPGSEARSKAVLLGRFT